MDLNSPEMSVIHPTPCSRLLTEFFRLLYIWRNPFWMCASPRWQSQMISASFDLFKETHSVPSNPRNPHEKYLENVSLNFIYTRLSSPGHTVVPSINYCMRPSQWNSLNKRVLAKLAFAVANDRRKLNVDCKTEKKVLDFISRKRISPRFVVRYFRWAFVSSSQTPVQLDCIALRQPFMFCHLFARPLCSYVCQTRISNE